MKRLISVLCVLSAFLTLCPFHALASDDSHSDENIILFNDGSYIVVELSENLVRATNTKTQTKTSKYYNSNDVLQWTVVLTGTFTYNGTTSSCTASNCSITISNDNWYTISKASGKSGNTATADVTMGYKLLGITTTKKTLNMTLTCDKDGNFS